MRIRTVVLSVTGDPIAPRPGQSTAAPADHAPIAAPPRVIYETRVVISGPEDDTAMAAVKLRAFVRRCPKPPGVSIRLADEHNRPESSRDQPRIV
jgi:hypothetical protein